MKEGGCTLGLSVWTTRSGFDACNAISANTKNAKQTLMTDPTQTVLTSNDPLR